MGPYTEADLTVLRTRVRAATNELLTAVADLCPKPHNPMQHRDGFPPWCGACGRTDGGVTVSGTILWNDVDVSVPKVFLPEYRVIAAYKHPDGHPDTAIVVESLRDQDAAIEVGNNWVKMFPNDIVMLVEE